MEVQAPYLRCPRDHISHRPFQGLTGLKCRGKSLVLQRALTDFGAEKSFQRASEQLKEHYGVELHRSSVREVVEQQAGRAAVFVDRERREALAGYGRRGDFPLGELWLIVESDGCMIRTGELGPAPEGGVTPGGAAPSGGGVPSGGKYGSAWWRVDTVNPMLALRTLRANGQWDAFWR